MHRFPARTALAGTLVALLTACGSTVPVSQLRGQGSQTPLTPGAFGSRTAQLPASAGGMTAEVGGPASAATGTLTAGSAPGGPTAAASGRAVAGGPVSTSVSGPLKVGVFYLHGGNQVISSAFPGSSVSFGDGQREAQAVIDDVNAHGGAGGHQLVPSWIPIEATDNDAARQQKCQGAVDDVHPVALFAIFNLSAGLGRCVQQANVLMIDVALGAGDQQLYGQARDFVFSPSQLTRDAEQKLVLGLARQQGRLPSGKTVGIVAEDDDPMYPRVVHNTIEPLLRSYGVPYMEEELSSGSDTSGMNGAILKLKTSGVDTVVFSLGSGGIPEVLFMQAAEQQQFRPVYLMGDSTDTNFVGQEAPTNQLKRLSGAGTYPLANVRADQYPSSPAERKCLALLNTAIGGYTNRYSSLTGTLYCEIIDSFAFVADHVRGAVTPGTWSQAFHALAGAYQPVTTFSTDFRPGRQDGASSYRSLGWSSECNCITYTSPTLPIP